MSDHNPIDKYKIEDGDGRTIYLGTHDQCEERLREVGLITEDGSQVGFDAEYRRGCRIRRVWRVT